MLVPHFADDLQDSITSYSRYQGTSKAIRLQDPKKPSVWGWILLPSWDMFQLCLGCSDGNFGCNTTVGSSRTSTTTKVPERT